MRLGLLSQQGVVMRQEGCHVRVGALPGTTPWSRLIFPMEDLEPDTELNLAPHWSLHSPSFRMLMGRV